MGYSTDFNGAFNLDEPLTEAHAKYLRKFSETRRMQRLPVITSQFKDDCRTAVGLPIGVDAEYYTGGNGGWDSKDLSVVDYNSPPGSQPGLWCQWIPSDDNKTIIWDGGEKFYNYVEWLEYIICHFLEPWGYTLNGTVTWQGEEHLDVGRIVVTNNAVKTQHVEFVDD